MFSVDFPALFNEINNFILTNVKAMSKNQNKQVKVPNIYVKVSLDAAKVLRKYLLKPYQILSAGKVHCRVVSSAG